MRFHHKSCKIKGGAISCINYAMHNTSHGSMRPYFYLVFDLKIKEKIKAKIIAAAIPPAVASKPPVKAPKTPFDLTALIAPFARDAPNPMIGTFIPAFANSEIGAKRLQACKNTPINTKVTKILAEVIFV